MSKILSDLAREYGINHRDYGVARAIIGDRPCDLIIAPDGNPYLYRWYVIPHNKLANVYFHLQIADDPERPLHDHPWDNQSVILAGGYTETFQDNPPNGSIKLRNVMAGDVVARRAHEAHRLTMLYDLPYTMTLFSTGPKRRAWGFWYGQEWVNAKDVCRMDGDKSVHIKQGDQWK